MTDHELIQALQMCSKVRCQDCLKEHTVCYRRKWMADAAIRLETLLAKNKQLCWIPVTERLPDKEFWEHQKQFEDEDLEVLVMIKGAKLPTMLLYNAEGEFYEQSCDGTIFYIVTHWMPMPEPTKEG